MVNCEYEQKLGFFNMVGRLSKLPEVLAREKEIIEFAKAGASKNEIAALVGITKETMRDWRDKKSPRFSQEFSDLIQIAETYSQAWWEKVGRTAIYEKEFQSALFNKQIAGRFPDDWRDTARRENQLLDADGQATNPNIVVEFVGDGTIQ